MESLNTRLAHSAHGLHRGERPGGGFNVNVLPMEEGVSALPILFPNPSSLSGLASVPKETRSRLHRHLCSSVARLPCSISAPRSPIGQHWCPRTTCGALMETVPPQCRLTSPQNPSAPNPAWGNLLELSRSHIPPCLQHPFMLLPTLPSPHPRKPRPDCENVLPAHPNPWSQPENLSTPTLLFAKDRPHPVPSRPAAPALPQQPPPLSSVQVTQEGERRGHV